MLAAFLLVVLCVDTFGLFLLRRDVRALQGVGARKRLRQRYADVPYEDEDDE